MASAQRTIHSAQHHFGWDNSLEPVLRIEPGETVGIGITDASGGQLSRSSTAAEVAALDFARVNPVTGPIFVEGACAGDALAVELLDIGISGWGWTGIIPGFGLLADEFPEPFLHIAEFDAEGVAFTPEIQLPTRPFPGTVGVALGAPGCHSVVPPRNVGGNMDLRDFVRGATLYLPVEVEGALLSIGDTHAAQGDGEVCGTAVETALDVVLRCTLVRKANLPAPQLMVPAAAMGSGPGDARVTTGVGPDLVEAARDAIRAMIDHLGRRYRLEPSLAYCLCSVAVSLRISEIVDAPNWLVSAYLPTGIFR